MNNHVIIATDFWKPEISGVARAIEDLVSRLEREGVEVTVIHPKLFKNMPLFFYPNVKIALFTKSVVEGVFKQKKPDYVYVATEGPVGWAVRSYCLAHRLSFITCYQGNIPYYIEHYTGMKSDVVVRMAYRYFKWFHEKSSAVIVTTKSLRRELAKRGFKKLVVCPLGVDTDVFKQNTALPAMAMPFKRPIFVYFGRLAKEKNIEEFLQCDLPGTKLVIGDGPERPALQTKYKDVKFAGWKRGADLVNMLSGCDVFVFPSITETFGLVVIEALACGIPVAAHKVMGPKDIITQGVDGFLGKDLKKAALQCLKLSREACRQKALLFSADRSFESFFKIMLKNPV